MKTIIYILIAVMIGSIVYSAIPRRIEKLQVLKQEIVLQAVKESVTPDELKKSSDIISQRLEFYGIRQFAIYPVSEKSQIVINFKDEQDILQISGLLTRKGKLEIFETFDRIEIVKKLSKNDSVFNYLKFDKSDDKDLYNPKLGKCIVGNTEKLSRYLNSELFSRQVPENVCFAWEIPTIENNRELSLYCLKLSSDNKPMFDSISVSDVQVKKESEDNFSLWFKLTGENAVLWQKATKANIGKSLALVIDRFVCFAPVVKDEIKGGNCAITGRFTENELKSLAAILKYGELPVEFRIK